MGRLLGKFILLISGILAFTATNASAVRNINPPIRQIEEVTKTTPLYLRLGIEVFSESQNRTGEFRVTEHYSHSSHVSHASHQSHYSGS
jgi:hypothetical protein